MPPKVKITREDIIKTSIALVKEKGEEALNARSIAASLGCSTQPVFSNFSSMEELDRAILEKAFEEYLSFLQNEAKKERYPKYKAYGMAYINFAKEEKELFKLLFMRDRRGEELSATPDADESVEMIMEANEISREKAELMHMEMWICVHGIATMIATSFFEPEEELISGMISDIYNGVRTVHVSKEN